MCVCVCVYVPSQVITYDKSLRTAEYAFEFALLNNRKKARGTHRPTGPMCTQNRTGTVFKHLDQLHAHSFGVLAVNKC